MRTCFIVWTICIHDVMKFSVFIPYSPFVLRMETALMPALKMFALPSVSGSVILECYTTADLVVAWFWLKQIPGQKLNPIVFTYYQEIKLQEEFLNESRIQFKVDDKKSALIFTKINSRDAAYYHCGVLLYENILFFITDTKPVKIIQHPVLDSHHVGDSVNLHCSIFGASCSGGQSVYWLRRESHSGIINADGDRKDQCETISVTVSTVQSCEHKVPKSLASDETYFCSVVTCGKLIVGNGTKLIADGKACFIDHIPIYS
uniref:Immunoglobulin V-set domain-containing protein n=1 Tax=Sinocyclocheilus grahami TaxID=75366 RepID=A0A672K7W4_SINGR